MAITELKVIDNHTRTLGDYLAGHLEAATNIYVSTAYIKATAVQRLIPAFEKLLDTDGVAEIIFSLDFGLSDPDGIRLLLELHQRRPDFGYYAFSDPRVGRHRAFHSKMYLLEEGGSFAAVVGSSNLTQGGLADNEEVNVAVEGTMPESFFNALVETHRRYKRHPLLFSPDERYIEAYSQIQERVSRAGIEVLEERATRELVERLRNQAGALAESLRTQKGLIIEALRVLPPDSEGYVHLSDISRHVERRARELGLDWKWDTLWNSIRGRLNEHTVGKGGEDLFERKGGIEGREGKYRLSTTGQMYQGR